VQNWEGQKRTVLKEVSFNRHINLHSRYTEIVVMNYGNV
jgi:hypothetical protein